MQLSSRQRALLDLYKRLRGTSPTLPKLLLISMRSFIIQLTIMVVGIAFVLAVKIPTPGQSMLFIGYFIGLGVGCMATVFGSLRRTVQLWPVVEQIVNWQKVDELLASPSSSMQNHTEINPYSN